MAEEIGKQGKQKTENRKQETENRKQKTGNRKQKTGNKETGNRKQETRKQETRKQETENRKQGNKETRKQKTQKQESGKNRLQRVHTKGILLTIYYFFMLFSNFFLFSLGGLLVFCYLCTQKQQNMIFF